MTDQIQSNINVVEEEKENQEDLYTNLLYFKEDAPPTPSPKLNNILEKRIVPDMQTFEEDLMEIYNIYINTTNITDIRCIRNALNIPKLVGGRSLHIASVHNPYDYDQLERNKYKLFNGYAQWTRFNQLDLDDTLRINKIQQQIKKMVGEMKEFSENKIHNNQEFNNMLSLLTKYKEQHLYLIAKCEIMENKIALLSDNTYVLINEMLLNRCISLLFICILILIVLII